jgi:hypothetical protein
MGAYNAGYAARKAKEPLSANPYSDITDRVCWAQGWMCADAHMKK